jgi:7-keto-8-aminopelargonate synthetase-like enzyme
VTRDRDPAGRPRNARPRDGLGRPLDRADDASSEADRIPDDLVITGAEAAALADRLLGEGIYVRAFSFPVVPRGKARIRTQMSAAHSRDDLDQAITAFEKVRR